MVRLRAVVTVALIALSTSRLLANDILIKNSAQIDRYDGQTGALIGIFASALETPEGFCYDGQGRFCVAGNALGFGHLVVEGVPGPPEYSPIYQRPGAIALGPDGKIYGTSNHFEGSGITGIVRFNNRTPEPFVTSGLPSARDLVFGPDGNLYVIENAFEPGSDAAEVYRFDGTTGASMGVFASGGGLTDATGMAFGPDGNLYVAALDGSVLRFSGITGAFESTFIASGAGGQTRANDLIFGDDGTLYVLGAAAGHAGVRRFEGTTGAFLDVFIADLQYNGGSMIGFVVPEPSTVATFVVVGALALARPTGTRKIRRTPFDDVAGSSRLGYS